METFSAVLALCFERGIRWSSVDSPHKCQWRGALIFSLIYAWTNGWANTRDAEDLGSHCAHYEVTVMSNITTTRQSATKNRKCLITMLYIGIYFPTPTSYSESFIETESYYEANLWQQVASVVVVRRKADATSNDKIVIIAILGFQCYSDVSCMMTSSNGNIFRVTGHLCGEFTGHRWIPHTKASDAELWCFLWSASE